MEYLQANLGTSVLSTVYVEFELYKSWLFLRPSFERIFSGRLAAAGAGTAIEFCEKPTAAFDLSTRSGVLIFPRPVNIGAGQRSGHYPLTVVSSLNNAILA
ncbi:MAG: hypothetical protein L6422_01800 [Candidatus Marinimicrobia bacterium]|nr:hypothetical protein [Euryarchaeota archaeon]MCG2715015.1 hypothetical protein [Candidatus Neomarinimicrobiota bacterium]MCG2737486.1 hypothetical protein [Candidatus Methanoperedenaceae archaeon]